MKANAELLAAVLRALESDAVEQEAYLGDRGPRDDVDPAQEFAEEWSEAFDDMNWPQPLPDAVATRVAEVDRLLLHPRLGEGIDALYTDELWAAIRITAAQALRAMRAAGLIADMIPYRLYPVRYAYLLEPLIGPADRWPAIVLTQSEFDSFEAAWEAALPSTTPPSKVALPELQTAARQVYRAFPDILDALDL
jgi:hypothetical protein